MRSVGEVGVKPAKCSSFDSEVAESGEQDGVVYSIEGCTQVKEGEEVEGTRVGRDEEVIEDFEESGFCALEGAEARLEGFKKVIGVEMGLELCGDDAFKGFGEEGEVGDWAVVTEGGGVETRFLEGGGDSSRFEGRGDRSMGQ